jgi:peptidoglycan/xylan/chitin deacetylase (PgdA/CDA1 family)
VQIISHGLTGSVARRAKGIAGWIVFRTGLYRLLRRDEAVIVLFHRVHDVHPRDALTHSSREFEAFVRFFSQYFDVIPLTDLLDRLKTGRQLRGCLSITFDDGYHGNAAIAAPILERFGQRACFFVTTQWIGTDHVPWWDADNKVKTEWMTWTQVRSLRSNGHDIGSHTETHPDLGVISADEARREVGEGSAHLDAELGEHSGLFAYPFGGRKNMSAENQSVVSRLGLRCCLSAFGGVVRPGDDPLHLNRIPISDWFVSPYHFGFELVTGRLNAD